MNEFMEQKPETPSTWEFHEQNEYPPITLADLVAVVAAYLKQLYEALAERGEGVLADYRERVEGGRTIEQPDEGDDGDEEEIDDGEEDEEGDENDEGTDAPKDTLQTCIEAAREVLPPERLAEWPNMTPMERCELLKDLSDALAEGMDITYNGIVFGTMKEGTYGATGPDGIIYINEKLVQDPSMMAEVIDTVAHEMRHQLQFQSLEDPEKFGIAEATAAAWRDGIQNYGDYAALVQFDLQGYHYNPVEVDARNFGENIASAVVHPFHSQIVAILNAANDHQQS